MAAQRFAVGVRVRPPIDRNGERFDVEAAVKADDCTVLLSNLGSQQSQVKRQTFTFDFIWDRDNGQEEVYEGAVCSFHPFIHPEMAPWFTLSSPKWRPVVGMDCMSKSPFFLYSRIRT